MLIKKANEKTMGLAQVMESPNIENHSRCGVGTRNVCPLCLRYRLRPTSETRVPLSAMGRQTRLAPTGVS